MTMGSMKGWHSTGLPLCLVGDGPVQYTGQRAATQGRYWADNTRPLGEQSTPPPCPPQSFLRPWSDRNFSRSPGTCSSSATISLSPPALVPIWHIVTAQGFLSCSLSYSIQLFGPIPISFQLQVCLRPHWYILEKAGRLKFLTCKYSLSALAVSLVLLEWGSIHIKGKKIELKRMIRSHHIQLDIFLKDLHISKVSKIF